jgi:hypothetical protein
LKSPTQKKASGVVQGAGPEFKPQYHKKKKKKKKERKKETQTPKWWRGEYRW